MVSSPDSAPTYAARSGEPSTYEVEQSAAQGIRQALEALLAEPAESDQAEDGSSDANQSED